MGRKPFAGMGEIGHVDATRANVITYGRVTFTPTEVAMMLQVTRKTIYRWIDNGDLKAARTGSKLWRISRESVDAFLLAGSESPAPAPKQNQPKARAKGRRN